MSEIDALLQEHRSFSPSGLLPQGRARLRRTVYASCRQNPEAFWEAQAKRAATGSSRGTRCSTGSRRTRSGSSAASSTSRPTASTGTSHGPPQQGRADLGRRARRPAHAHVLGSVRRGAEVRERAQVARRQARRSRRHLHAADPRSRDRDARLRAHRRDPLGGVRRLLARVAARPHQRRAGQGAHHRRRRLSARQRRAAQAQLRQGARGVPRRSSTSSSCSAAPARRATKLRRNEGRPRPLVAPADARRRRTVRAREDGRRGRALHPLHVGHHGKAERHRAHHRRLPRRRRRPRPSWCSISRTTTSSGARPTWAG